MALGSSVYKMVFDTQGLNTLTASRRELALQKTIMEETATTSEKLAVSEANLDRMVRKELITLEQKAAVLQKLQHEQNATDGSNNLQLDSLKRLAAAQASGIPLVGQLVAGFESFGPAGAAAAAALMGISAAANVVSGAIHVVIENVTEQIDKIDTLIAQAETINVPVDQFQRLAHAADYANIEQSAFAAGTEKMLVAISKTADGTSKKLIPAFELAGLDAKKLKDMEPGEAFAEITRGLDTIPNAADKARAATAIFGSADFLRIDTEHIERASKLMEQLRPVLNEVSAATFSDFDESVKDMNMALDVTWQKVAMGLVPALTDAADAATALLVEANQSDQLSDALQRSTDFARGFVMTLAEVPKHIDLMTGQIDAFLATHPKLLLMATVLEKIAGDTANLGEQARLEQLAATPLSAKDLEKTLGRELTNEEKAAAKSNRPVSAGEDDPIEHESKSIQDLIDKLKEEVATKGMSTAMAKVWKLEQLGAGEEVLQKNRELAQEFDQITTSEKAAKAIESFTESLRHQGESAAESARRLADLKLAHDGVDEATRKSLMSQFDASEAQKVAIEIQKKADATAKRHADALENLGEKIQQEEAKLQGYNSAVGDNEARMRAGQRAALEWQLTNDKADATTKASTLSMFDATTALEKRAKATKTAIEIQQELTKEIRQTGMTDSEKKLDDAKIAGVNDEELKIIETLQKELHLREEIHKSITATSSAIKAGSREAADAFAEANQIAVRKNFLDRQGSVTTTALPQQPVVSAVSDSSADAARKRLMDQLDGDKPSAASAREKLTDQLNGLSSSVETARSKLMDQLNRPADDKNPSKSSADSARDKLMGQLNGGVTATTLPAPPEPVIPDWGFPTHPITVESTPTREVTVDSSPVSSREHKPIMTHAELSDFFNSGESKTFDVPQSDSAIKPPEPFSDNRSRAAEAARRRINDEVNQFRTEKALREQSSRESISAMLTEKRAADSIRTEQTRASIQEKLTEQRANEAKRRTEVRADIDRTLGRGTPTPIVADGTAKAPKAMVAINPSRDPDMKENNKLLNQLVEKEPVTITVEEVTL